LWIYDFPAGSIWDFFLDVLEIRKIPTTKERIEIGNPLGDVAN
jgi:hypothetical protein